MNDDPPPGFLPIRLADPFTAEFGGLYVDHERGCIGFRVGAQHLNKAGMCHGGALATFCDLQVTAVKPQLRQQQHHRPTVTLSVDYAGPAQLGDWVEAQVSLVKETRSLVFTNAVLTANGRVVAQSRAIYHTPRKVTAEAG